jgi:hypothetical protein
MGLTLSPGRIGGRFVSKGETALPLIRNISAENLLIPCLIGLDWKKIYQGGIPVDA